MFQVSRDADQAIRGLRENHFPGHPQDGCCSIGTGLPMHARRFRGLRGRCPTDRVSWEVQRGRTD